MRERREMVYGDPTLGVFFDIDKLEKKTEEFGVASYGFVGWKIIWGAVSTKNLRFYLSF